MKFSSARKLKSLFWVTAGGYISLAGLTYYREEESFYRNIVMPLVRLLNPEQAHNIAVYISKYRLLPKSKYQDPPSLKVQIFGREFSNPIGIAAGFDKDAKAVLGLKDIGFGFVEIGSVTPNPQPGNAKPRVFRLAQDSAVINRYGFNSEGHDEVLKRIQVIRSGKEEVILGVNLGKNKNSDNDIDDYVKGILTFGPVADYLVINISSPNTPGLRSMQKKEILSTLLTAALKARNSLPNEKRPPLLLKLAPDLSTNEKKDIADVLKQDSCKVDGLIVSNTTIERPDSLQSEFKNEIGGLSGKPLKDKSTNMIKEMKTLTHLPIIGVGGISSGQDAYEKIKAGANLVQIYTAIIYEGPTIVTRIKKDLAELLAKDNVQNISEVVGK